jgi:hypothetical protein
VSLKRYKRNNSNDTIKDQKRWLEWTKRAFQMCWVLFAFRRLVWHAPITVHDLLWWHWIHLVDIFSTIPVVSSLEFWYASKSFYFFYFSLSSFFINYDEWKKRPKRHIKTPIIKPPAPLERYQRDESNATKEDHQLWSKCATRVIQKQMSPEIFRRSVQPTSVIGHRSWSYLVLLDLSHQYFFNGSSNVIEVSEFLKGFIFPRSSFFSLYSLLSLYCKLVLVYFFFYFEETCLRHSWLVTCEL